MKKIVIASSAKFKEKVCRWKELFEQKGYEVIDYPRKIDQTISEEYQKAHIRFFKSLEEADILFVLNEDKNGIEGYIGYEVFAELSYFMVENRKNKTNKKIYLLKMPSKDLSCYMEIKNFVDLGWIEIYKNRKTNYKKSIDI